MNLQRPAVQLSGKDRNSQRRTANDHGDLLPWADPYIASLMREHERQMRGQGHSRPRRA